MPEKYTYEEYPQSRLYALKEWRWFDGSEDS